jgi:PII-like signaling protein/predicted transcriptional regulator
MLPAETVQRVRIYLREHDRVAGQPLYLLLLERLQRDGATGATALKGLAGFGPSHGARGNSTEPAQSPPVVVEWVDRAERVARLLPLLDELLPDALITIEDLRVRRAMLRASGPFGERPIGEVAGREIATAEPRTSILAAARLLLKSVQPLLPVLEDRRVVQVLAPADLEQLATPRLSLRLARAMDEAEREQALAALPARTLSEVAVRDPRAVSVDSLIPPAVRTMVEWALDGLPVIDREGRFAGVFGVEHALRAALDARTSADGAVRDPTVPPPIQLLMQRSVPVAGLDTPAAAVLEQLRATADGLVVLVDQSRPAGLLTDVDVLRGLDRTQRAAWIEAARSSGAPSVMLETVFATRTAADLPRSQASAIAAGAPRDEAIRRLLDEDREWLVAVDDSGQLVGLVGRRTLLRSLAQECVE